MYPNHHVQLITLKEFFGSEAKCFTPWLSENIQVINDIFQETDLKLYKRELKIDRFYVDLSLRRDRDIYLVENQYGESDHDHLGKCIVYSILTNAKKTCWICEKISNEHLKIIRFLNIDLYIVELSIIKSKESEFIRLIVHNRDSSRALFYRTRDKGKTLQKVA